MRRILLQRILPVVVTVGLLGLVFLWIEDPTSIPRHIAKVPWHIHILFIVVTLFSMGLRAYRWRALLPDHPLTGRRCAGPLFIGFMMNSLLPARAGEFARSIALARRAQIPLASVFGSVVLERVIDGLFLLGSFVLVLSALGASVAEETVTFGGREISGALMQTAARSSSLMILVLLAGITAILFPAPRRWVEAATRKVIPPRLSEPTIAQLEKLVAGFRSLHSPLAIAEILLWTLGVWATVALSIWIAGFGFPQFDLSFLQAWAIMVIICVAILLPASPGYWGLYEVGVIIAFKALQISDEVGLALSFSIVIHVWQYIPIVLAGLVALWIEGLHFAQLRGSQSSASAPTEPTAS